MIKLIKNLYKKIKLRFFKIRNPVGSTCGIPNDKFTIDMFQNIEWIACYPFHIINFNNKNYYIPYVVTKRNKNGDTVMNEFLITKN